MQAVPTYRLSESGSATARENRRKVAFLLGGAGNADLARRRPWPAEFGRHLAHALAHLVHVAVSLLRIARDRAHQCGETTLE